MFINKCQQVIYVRAYLSTVFQLYETFRTTTIAGIALVGDSMSAKSTALNVVRRLIQTKHQINIHFEIINPSTFASPVDALFGTFTASTLHEGVCVRKILI